MSSLDHMSQSNLSQAGVSHVNRDNSKAFNKKLTIKSQESDQDPYENKFHRKSKF